MASSYSKQSLATVALLLSWCAALLICWTYAGTDFLAVAMLWNLFLASVPLMWGAAFRTATERKHPLWAALFFGLWLLFLPNAPYILTDLVHLGPRPTIPPWYLLATLMSCAGAGTLLGYLSLSEVHGVIQRTFGKAAGWLVASLSLFLCGFGIYLGRFLRWNSWDALTKPLDLFQTIVGQFIDPGPHPHPVSVTLVFGIGLIVGYIALRGFAVVLSAETN
jgi:uncharacterized membrane protein